MQATNLKPKVHVEEYLFGELPVKITTDTAYTDPTQVIDLMIGDQHLHAHQAERLLGAILRAIFLSEAGQGIPMDPVSAQHPLLSAAKAQQVVNQFVQSVVEESFLIVYDDNGALAAKFAIEYQLVAKQRSGIVIPGEEQQPVKVEAVVPEFRCFQIHHNT